MQPTTQRGLDGQLQLGRHLQLVGHRADDASQIGALAAQRAQHGTGPAAEAFTLILQPLEQFKLVVQAIGLAAQTGDALAGARQLGFCLLNGCADCLTVVGAGLAGCLQLGDAALVSGDLRSQLGLAVDGRSQLVFEPLMFLAHAVPAAFLLHQPALVSGRLGLQLCEEAVMGIDFAFVALALGFGLVQTGLRLADAGRQRLHLATAGFDSGTGAVDLLDLGLQPLAQRLQFLGQVALARLELADALAADSQLALRTFGLTVESAAFAVPVAQLIAQCAVSLAQCRVLLIQMLQGFLARLDGGLRCLRVLAGRVQFLQGAVPAEAIPDAQLGVEVGLDLHPLLGAASLHLEVTQPRLDLTQDVLHPFQIVARFVELAQGSLALGLMAGDARSFLDQRAPLVRFERQRLVDQPLTNDGVGAFGQTGLRQQLRHVAQAHAGAIEVILVFTGAVGAAGNDDLAVVQRQPAVVVVQCQAGLGHAHAGALVGAGEDHVFTALGAQTAETLFAQHPLDGISDVGLAAAVGADDRGETALEGEVCPGGKGFVAL